MKLCFNELLLSISYCLDCVERTLVGVSTNHSKRVAYLCTKMGKSAQLSDKELSDLIACAVLHDNALTEYIQAEYLSTGNLLPQDIPNQLGLHCSFGERNMRSFPFFNNAKNAILYHHENFDGSGPFGKSEEQIPLFAAFIHLADQLDATFNLSSITEKKYKAICTYLKDNTSILFSEFEVNLFFESFSFDSLHVLEDTLITQSLKDTMPYIIQDFSPSQLMDIGTIFAKIVDYKSTFTSLHSIGIAHKAYSMGNFYHYDDELKSKLFLAGALHDIGKLSVDTIILEKPDKLTEEEFNHIKSHASLTYEILNTISGLEEITTWASYHHEKLDGSGYPFGYQANQLNFFERLMACLDIYQALREDRPYKQGKSHTDTMTLLFSLGEKGLLDTSIIKDINIAFQ